MSEHSARKKRAHRTRLRTVIVVGVLVGALGVATPALALIGVGLPIPSGGNPTTTVTTHVEDS